MKNQIPINKFTREGDKLIPYTEDRNHKVLCPVCGSVMYDDNFVCDICHWEFDGIWFDYQKVPVNFCLSPKKWRQKFLKKCSPEIRSAYKNLIKVTHNKYRLFDLEYIKYNPRLYRNFYNSGWFDQDTKEFISTYINLNISKN